MHFNISHNSILQKRKNGVQLVSPLKNSSSISRNSIQSIFSIPCNVFIMLNEDIFLGANEVQLNDVNVEQPEFIGKPVCYFLRKCSSLSIIKNNKDVIKKDKIAFINESVIYKNNAISQEALSIKLPLYDQYQKTMGLLGFGIKPNQNNLGKCLAMLQQAGILNDSQSSVLSSTTLRIGDINLTIRESECIKLVIRGKTAKEIASLLELSNRTVEYYLENIKYKLKVNSRSELIDKVISYILY